MPSLSEVLNAELNPPLAHARRVPSVRRRNALNIDPSRTTLLRRQFMTETTKRLRELKKEIWQWLVMDDELGLIDAPAFKLNWTNTQVDTYLNALEKNLPTVNVRKYEFVTSDRKVDAFNSWLQTMIDGKVLGVQRGQDAWTAKYIDSAWRQGLNRSYLQSRRTQLGKSMDFMEGLKSQFLRSAFNQPELASKVRLLGTRTFNGMEGFTRSMKNDLNRILADGLVNGKGVRSIARDMFKRIDGLSRSRAMTIARTEVIHAQAEGQLDGFEMLGVEEVGAEVEWSTAGDDTVCPQCASMQGQIFSIKDARGMIPLHPNCRCAWMPVIPKPGKKAKAKR